MTNRTDPTMPPAALRAAVLLAAGLLLALPACSADEAPSPTDSAEQAADTADVTGATDSGPDAADTPAPDGTGGDASVAVPFDECGDERTPAECFADMRDPDSESVSLALAIAKAQMDAHPAASLGWDWGEAVLMWSFVQLHAVTGKPELQAYVADWMDHHIDEGWAIQTSDSCSPAALAAVLHGATGDDKYLAVVDDALDYLANRALRSEEGGISHMGTIPVVTLWTDSLFMFGNVWFAWWQTDGDEASGEALGEQLRVFSGALQDPGGLYRHAKGWVVEPEEPVYWARGNGWAAAAAAQYLHALALRGDSDATALAALRAQVEGLTAAQDKATGLWWTLLDKPDSIYLETSATALSAYAMARAWRARLLDDDALSTIALAMAGVRGRIITTGEHPVVTGTSGPTSADLAEVYAKVPLVDDISYGVGAAILALVETSGLPLPEVSVTLAPVEPEPEPEVWEPLAMAPSEAFLTRRETYLQQCHDASGPGSGEIYGQVCRVALGSPVDEEVIQAAIDKVKARQDTADFRMAALVRLLYLDDETKSLTAETRAAIEEAVLGFRYWLDEPGDDKMCYWSENHQILFHSAELLAGQRHIADVFPNAGMTGAEHVAHAKPRILRWLDRRLRLGFSEWHSNVYFNEDIPALVNLADFAEDPDIRERAAIVLDVLALDLLTNNFNGSFATAHGRTYDGHLIGGLNDSTEEAAWVMVGIGQAPSATNFSAAFLATSDGWFPAPVLEAVAAAADGPFEHRQRDGIDVASGPEHGIGYTEPDDVVFWAGMAALATAEAVDGTALLLDTYDLWDGFLFGDLPDSILTLLKGLKGTPQLAEMAADLEVITRGIALESMSTYTFRTDQYQLSGAQDYNPGLWGTQTHMWQATLDTQAYVFTSAPANLGELLGSSSLTLATGWVGGFMPRVLLHRNVGVIRYRPEHVPGLADDLSNGTVHAYFPRAEFDEVREEGPWVIGRKGKAYLAFASEHPMVEAPDNDYELIVDTAVNTFLVELSSEEEAGSFDAFVASIKAAPLEIGEGVSYESPSVGLVEVGPEGPLSVDGVEIDGGPYPRWKNPYVNAEFGASKTVVELDGDRLVLDGDAGTRTVWRLVTAD